MSNTVLDAKTSSLREHPPSSYLIKFENITQLRDELNDVKYESRLFPAGGYNWRLIIYPKGNEIDQGSGFISMYVEIDSTNLMSTPLTEVLAYLIFFVYNKKTDKYFTIKDTELKRFNALRRVRGLSQVLSLETFNDPKNGYIFEGDQCEFGVDVLVAPSLTKWEVVSFNQKIPNPKFLWTLKKFNELKENFYDSDKFIIGGKQWFLKLHPRGGDSREKGKSISIYLYTVYNETLNEDEKVYTRVHLRLVDPRGTTHIAREMNNWYKKPHTGFGWNGFAPLDKLRDYLDAEGSLNIETEFYVVSTSNYSPSI
ncbi:Ubiquitin C-terminal hydrolase 13 [Cardamine amara subsp. amara]|uniref:Ubiquitin C-terminal hydrolase 13 n=1 Tax=Cardamine amara subsp. amara TaxID=228776 RepID=A0ABD0ZSA6_CARAN